MSTLRDKRQALNSDIARTVSKHPAYSNSRLAGLKPWKPGQSGNPKGRPKGCRDRFSEDFYRAMHETWLECGQETLRRFAVADPAGYVKLTAEIVMRTPEPNPENQYWCELLDRLRADINEERT